MLPEPPKYCFSSFSAHEVHANLSAEQWKLGPPSRTLETAADAQVQDLYARSFFAHINPDGKNPGDRALAASFCHKYVGENIAAGQLSPSAVMVAWQNSPSHNENMLTADYVYVGMGHYIDPNGRHYWAQEFAYDVPGSVASR